MQVLLLLLLLIAPVSSSGMPADGLFSQEERSFDHDTASQPSPLELNEEKIASYREQADFDYSEDTGESWWTRFKRYLRLKWESLWEWLFGDYQTTGILLFLMELLPYLILGGLLLFLVWLFNKINPAAGLLEEKPEQQVFLNEEDEIVQSRDVGKLIQEALAEQNYRLAIRYQYLLVLQLLDRAKIISYESSKTNQEYVQEIQEESLRKPFRQLSRIYDFTWYGSFSADEAAYERMKKEFSVMKQLTKARDGQE